MSEHSKLHATTKLRQPHRYSHNLIKNESVNSQDKTKPISKLHNKKVINKKNEPSALRLQAINQTFHKIQCNTDKMIKNFDIDNEELQVWLKYESKVKCDCGRNVKYYCLKCMFKNKELNFVKIELPFQVRIIHHNLQKINKSSVIPMALLSPQISIQMFSNNSSSDSILKGFNKQETFILFPHKNSKRVSEIKDPKTIKSVVVLDCTWFQTDQLVSSLEQSGFNNFIRLQDYDSLYWRYNHHSDKALSSAEALIYFTRQYQASLKLPQNQYDKLMCLYCLNLKIIEQSYRSEEKCQKEEKGQEKQEENQ